jgi:integrase/recombinase XerD
MVEPVNRFLNYLTVEKGLAPNTLEAYKRDILQFQSFLNETATKITTFKRNDILSYVNELRDTGHQATTLARIISTIRGLCKFMLLEGIIEADPIENLSTPKGWKRIPKIIGINEVLSLLKQPEGTKMALRDRAILEMIYSSGLRASELVNIKLDNINFEAGFLSVRGKGSKERVVPINESALETLKQYTQTLFCQPSLRRRC